MTWVNQPPCSNASCKGNEDGKQMTSKETRGPVTEEEKRGGASRVEGMIFSMMVAACCAALSANMICQILLYPLSHKIGCQNQPS